MPESMKLSPSALATLSIPKGHTVAAFKTRKEWLAARVADVTASVAASLFGEVHPYQTAYALWALKSGIIEEDPEETPLYKRGRLLEPVALQLLREDRPDWNIEASARYFRDPGSRIGATPDAFATRPDIPGVGIVQAKTVGKFAFKKGWKTDSDDVEIPLWIAVQASVEAALTGATWAAVAAMELGDGGLDLHVQDIPLRPALMVKLRELADEFWRRVGENDPYPPDFGKDAALIARLYADADEGAEADLSENNRMGELLDQREALKAREAEGNAAEKQRKLIDSEIIFALGNAARGCLADGRVVEAKTTRRGGYEVKPTSFRTVKVKGNVDSSTRREPARSNGGQPAARLADGPF